MKRKLNMQAAVALATYTIFVLFLSYLLISGVYLQYVTPRSVWYIGFAIVVFCVWIWTGMRQLFLPRYRVRIQKYLILVILVLAVILPHEALSEAEFNSGYIEANNLMAGEQPGKAGRLVKIRSVPDVSAAGGGYQPTLFGYDAKTQTITVRDMDFLLWLYEIIGHREFYDGQKIVVKAYVLKDGAQALQPGEFVSARLAMTCCLADVAPVGLITEYDEADGLAENDWVVVSGTLFVDDYDGRPIVKIKAGSVEAGEAPEMEYVYPF